MLRGGFHREEISAVHKGGMTYGEVLDRTFNCVTPRRYFVGVCDD